MKRHEIRGEGKAAVLGGDKREIIIARHLAELGLGVSLFGTLSDYESSQFRATSLENALADANVIVTPMPGIANSYELYAPHSPEPIHLNEEALKNVQPGALYFGGVSTNEMRGAGYSKDIRWCDMGDDDFIQVQHAIPTAEAALSIAIREIKDTLVGLPVAVTGYGRIGALLAGMLRALGANVTVVARRREIRARAVASGHSASTIDPESLVGTIRQSQLVFTTAPGELLNDTLLKAVPEDALVIDLASPPGGLDHSAAEALGTKTIWARGLADWAPEHSAKAQFEFILQRLEEFSLVTSID